MPILPFSFVIARGFSPEAISIRSDRKDEIASLSLAMTFSLYFKFHAKVYRAYTLLQCKLKWFLQKIVDKIPTKLQQLPILQYLPDPKNQL